ncbi:unnamed protein product [Camellia sinensis]
MWHFEFQEVLEVCILPVHRKQLQLDINKHSNQARSAKEDVQQRQIWRMNLSPNWVLYSVGERTLRGSSIEIMLWIFLSCWEEISLNNSIVLVYMLMGFDDCVFCKIF